MTNENEILMDIRLKKFKVAYPESQRLKQATGKKYMKFEYR